MFMPAEKFIILSCFELLTYIDESSLCTLKVIINSIKLELLKYEINSPLRHFLNKHKNSSHSRG